MNTKLIRGLIVLAVFLVLPMVVIGTVSGMSLINLVNQEPVDVSVEIWAPEVVGAGDEFTLEIVVRNNELESQVLDSIDFGGAFATVFDVREVVPEYQDKSEFAELQSFFFKQEIAPGETVRVEFVAAVEEAGEQAGEIAVCINTGINCAVFNGVLIVE